MSYKIPTTRYVLPLSPSLSSLTAHLQSMTLEQAQVLALKVLKQVMEEKLDHNNVQLAQVVPGKGFAIMNEAELKAVIERFEGGAVVAPVA